MSDTRTQGGRTVEAERRVVVVPPRSEPPPDERLSRLLLARAARRPASGEDPLLGRPLPPSVAHLLEPRIRVDGIRWTGGVGGRPLRVELAVENPHRWPTRATTALLRRADFGAFRPWTPYRTLAVPPIPPGGRVTLVADEAFEPSSRMSRRLRRLMLSRSRLLQFPSTPVGAWSPGVEPMHLVGNFDLRIGSQQPVERHCGDLAGLRAGSQNIAVFKVGDGVPDSYRFSVARCESGWEVVIGCEGRFDLHEGKPIQIHRSLVTVAITPPKTSSNGIVGIEAQRVGTGQSTTVELSLETRSPGNRTYIT